MELLGLLGIVFLLWLLIGPIVAFIRSGNAQDEARDTRRENDRLKDQLRELRLRIDAIEAKRSAPATPETPAASAPSPKAKPPAAFHPPVAGAEDADAAEHALHHQPDIAAFEIREAPSVEERRLLGEWQGPGM